MTVIPVIRHKGGASRIDKGFLRYKYDINTSERFCLNPKYREPRSRHGY